MCTTIPLTGKSKFIIIITCDGPELLAFDEQLRDDELVGFEKMFGLDDVLGMDKQHERGVVAIGQAAQSCQARIAELHEGDVHAEVNPSSTGSLARAEV
jgi:hypothetical protein